MPFPTPAPPIAPDLNTITGRIHSTESLGTVDGPGIRFVVFTQGCPLRCQYCHNPDCWALLGGEVVTVETVMAEILKYRSYLKQGGVTISGGEPTLQPEFVGALLQRCQQEGLHTALDTSGYVPLEVAKPVLDFVDLVLLDIKSYTPQLYRQVTCVAVQPTLTLAEYLSSIAKPMWIRFVLVPGLTDDRSNLEGLARFVSGLQTVERLEVLPCHQMGAYKWKQLGYTYPLENLQPVDPDLLQATVDYFQSWGLPALGI